MYDAQQARRVLDRLVGYQISPILWTKVRRGLSAGRVQSVAVRLVVERENEIAAFVPVEYWSIEADLKAALPPQFRAKLIKLDGEKIELGSQEVTLPLVEELQRLPVVVQSVQKKEVRPNARATSLEFEPARVQKHLERDMFRLYELIWNRFIACQMVPAVFDQTIADIEAGGAAALRITDRRARSFIFRATGQTLKFPGYLAV